MKLPHRQRLLVIGAAGAIALLILDRVVFTPLTNSWRAHAAEIAALRKSITNGKSLIERARSTESLWAEMQANAMPRDPAQAEQELITDFDKWRQASGINVGSIKPQWKRGANDRYPVLECKVDATGTLATLARFVFEVEKSPLALRIESMEMTSHDDQGQKITLALLVSGLRLIPLEGRP